VLPEAHAAFLRVAVGRLPGVPSALDESSNGDGGSAALVTLDHTSKKIHGCDTDEAIILMYTGDGGIIGIHIQINQAHVARNIQSEFTEPAAHAAIHTDNQIRAMAAKPSLKLLPHGGRRHEIGNALPRGKSVLGKKQPAEKMVVNFFVVVFFQIQADALVTKRAELGHEELHGLSLVVGDDVEAGWAQAEANGNDREMLKIRIERSVGVGLRSEQESGNAASA
jgi:hypothetical protein